MYRTFIISAGFLFTLIASTRGQSLLTPVARTVSIEKPFQFVIGSSPTEPTVVEVTTNLQTWTALQTNSAGSANVTVTDWNSHNHPARFYRVRSLSTLPTNQMPTDLGDLTQLNNSVFMAGEGLNALQFSPSGKLGFIAWRGQDLIYRERINGSWRENVIGSFGGLYVPGPREEYRFQPHAALLFDSQSRAHILRLNGASVAHHVQQNDGTFVSDSAISLSGIGSSFSLFTAAIGPNDKLHLAVVGSGSSPAIKYGSNKDGSWNWQSVANVSGNPRGFLQQSYAPRWFSMAVDSQNKAHLTYCPQFMMGQSPEGHLRPYSELHYATDRDGSWTTLKIAGVADGSGDAGAGASIAIGPDNQPAIASWHNERAPTGSSQENFLNYHRRDSNGSWSTQRVNGNSAGYEAGDGPKGGGFAPHLRFDAQGRPNIAFCDDAAQHFSGTGQNEYAGNLRHTYWNGTQWVFKTIYGQSNALNGQIVYPAMAIAGSEMVFVGIKRDTGWINSRTAVSTYNWFYVQSALP